MYMLKLFLPNFVIAKHINKTIALHPVTKNAHKILEIKVLRRLILLVTKHAHNILEIKGLQRLILTNMFTIF